MTFVPPQHSSGAKGESFSVIIVGGGPTGLVLAIDLGLRGVDCVVLERNAAPSPWPKFDRCNARTMESFRRMGLAERIRAVGYPGDNPMDVFLLTSLGKPAEVALRYPSVDECRQAIAACNDGSLPLEPYQLVSQNRTEPLLKEVAESTPNVTVRFGQEVTALEQDFSGVAVEVVDPEGRRSAIRGRFLVGCDGARSFVRKQLGIGLEGTETLELRQVIFYSEDLYDRIVAGKGRHYNFLDENHSIIVAQGDRKEFTLHTALPEGADFRREIVRLAGFDFGFEVRHVSTWTPRLLLADSYGDGRVFIAGDAAHQVIPTGGLGMNSGVGDALNISWKLAGVVGGWGGRELLDSYEDERRPVAVVNRSASEWAAMGVVAWHSLVKPGVPPDDELLESARVNHARMHGMLGAELGYSYAGSPIVASETDGPVGWEINTYTPSASPGSRIPHMWLSDGRPVQDVLGDDYTLLDLRGDAELRPFASAFASAGVPVKLLRLEEPTMRRVYECSMLLIRPDLHVAWRGTQPPPDAETLARRVTGNLSTSRLRQVSRSSTAARVTAASWHL